LEGLEIILLVWFKQALSANVSINGPHLKEKALHVAAPLGIHGCRALTQPGIQDYIGKSAIVNPETVMDWKSKELLKIINRYKLKDIFNVDETGIFYNLKPRKSQTYRGDSCHGRTKPKQRVTVLLGCNADGTDKLPPLETGK
jgi:hypothetical protein